MALERELDRLARESAPVVDEGTTQAPVKIEKIERALLSEVEEGITPAMTINELENQVYLAKGADVDSIEASEQIIKNFVRQSWPEVQKVGYMQYKDIKVWIPGFFENKKAEQDMTLEQKIFGKK